MKTIFTLLLFSSLLLAGCNNQDPKVEKLYYDTLLLPDPKTEPESVGTIKDYENCIDLTAIDYILYIQREKVRVNNLKDLRKVLKIRKDDIIKQKMSIVLDSVTAYGRTVDVLDLFTETGITNFKIVTGDGTMPKYPPLLLKSYTPFNKDSLYKPTHTKKG